MSRDVFSFNDSNVYWRPLGHLFYLGIDQAAGLDPYYFHLAAVGVFLATLAMLYRFCAGLGLDQVLPLRAVAVCGLLPNHVDVCRLCHERASAASRIVRVC